MTLKEWIVDYLKKFKKREDSVAIEIEQSEQSPINTSSSAYKDLEIENVCRQVIMHAPNSMDPTREYIQAIFDKPIFDREEIKQRQDTIEELIENEELNQELTKVKINFDRFSYERVYYRNEEVQRLENARLFVNLIDSIHKMRSPETKRLKQIKEFGERVYKDDKFLRLRDFVRKVYEPADLGEVLAHMSHSIRNNELSSIQERRKFYSEAKIIEESIEKLVTEEEFNEFINKESKGINLLETIKKKNSFFNEQLFKFAGSLYEFQEKHNRDYQDVIHYLISLLDEAIYSRMPAVEAGQTGEEIGFYLGAANLHKAWAKKGFPLTKPRMIDKKEKRARIIDSYNTSLIDCCKEPAPNDIISDKETNLFVNTGPNNGGKTTYLRQVGQQYWLAQIGMLLPAKEAEFSVVDGIFTSFSGEDSTKDGTGQYLTELKRISSFTKSNNGVSTTPYSLLLFDEFANGTDHEESVIRTKIVLDYISRKGITAYFTTHKQEIADYVDEGKLPGSINLASEVKWNRGSIKYTHKILRNSREKSYGSIQADEMGITKEALNKCLDEETARGAYPVEDTRADGARK